MNNQDFSALVCHPERALPPHMAGTRAVRGLAIYRNNIHFSLIAALGVRFPVLRRMIGDESFTFCARAYVSVSKPSSPLLMFYGDDFPNFIAALPLLQEWPYLADVARVEAMRTHAYHAADCAALHVTDMNSDAIGRLLSLRFARHPAARLVSSCFPAATLWACGDPSVLTEAEWREQEVAITRAHNAVCVRAVPTGTAACLDALVAGTPLYEAVTASTPDPNAAPLLLAALLSCDLLAHP